MRKFMLYQFCGGERVCEPVIADGFVDAENKAKELLNKIWDNSPCDDTFVACVEHEYEMKYDHIIMQKDIFNEVYWKMQVMGVLCPIYYRLLDKNEEQQLQEWREEKDLNLRDLSFDELTQLRSEVCVGSCFLADYENSWFIDTNEVCDACDSYEKWLETERLEDTPENFAYFIQEAY